MSTRRYVPYLWRMCSNNGQLKTFAVSKTFPAGYQFLAAAVREERVKLLNGC